MVTGIFFRLNHLKRLSYKYMREFYFRNACDFGLRVVYSFPKF